MIVVVLEWGVQVDADEWDTEEYRRTEDADAVKIKKQGCFIAKLFKADALGKFSLPNLDG